MCVIIPAFHEDKVPTSLESGRGEEERIRHAVKSQSGDSFFLQMNPMCIYIYVYKCLSLSLSLLYLHIYIYFYICKV